jgi:hypothetical protein
MYLRGHLALFANRGALHVLTINSHWMTARLRCERQQGIAGAGAWGAGAWLHALLVLDQMAQERRHWGLAAVVAAFSAGWSGEANVVFSGLCNTSDNGLAW